MAKVKTTDVPATITIDSGFTQKPGNTTYTIFTGTGVGTLQIVAQDTMYSSTYYTAYTAKKNGTIIGTEGQPVRNGATYNFPIQNVVKGDVFTIWSKYSTNDAGTTKRKTIFTKNYIYGNDIKCQKCKVYSLKSIGEKNNVISFGNLPNGERRTGE